MRENQFKERMFSIKKLPGVIKAKFTFNKEEALMEHREGRRYANFMKGDGYKIFNELLDEVHNSTLKEEINPHLTTEQLNNLRAKRLVVIELRRSVEAKVVRGGEAKLKLESNGIIDEEII